VNRGFSLGDRTLDHLRALVDAPDVEGTRYELIELVGRGGMGSVWRARDRLLERDVALKVLNLAEPEAAAAADPAQGPRPAEVRGARIVQEAQVLARLEHPGIVPVHDAGVLPDGRAFACMKFVRGKRLDELVSAGLSESERLSIFSRIAESVAFAHSRGVLHLDLKPANIMVGEFGEVLVLDWGLARLEHRPQKGVRAGTLGFMAPEQERAAADLDARADVFALGRVLASLELGGREIAAIVARATRERREERYGSAMELHADVRAFLSNERVRALREGPAARLARFGRKYRAALWLVGAYALMRVGFELFRLWRESGNS
jgi:serine/threonine protein kinase